MCIRDSFGGGEDFGETGDFGGNDFEDFGSNDFDDILDDTDTNLDDLDDTFEDIETSRRVIIEIKYD